MQDIQMSLLVSSLRSWLLLDAITAYNTKFEFPIPLLFTRTILDIICSTLEDRSIALQTTVYTLIYIQKIMKHSSR